jgi:hypothetical protein
MSVPAPVRHPLHRLADLTDDEYLWETVPGSWRLDRVALCL